MTWWKLMSAMFVGSTLSLAVYEPVRWLTMGKILKRVMSYAPKMIAEVFNPPAVVIHPDPDMKGEN